MAFLCFCVCVTQNIRCHLVCICTRACLDQRGSNCASSDLAKLPSLPRTSEIHHVVISVERSTSVYINLVRCVYHGFTFSLVLGESPIAIVVCLIHALICSSGVLKIVRAHVRSTLFPYTLFRS